MITDLTLRGTVPFGRVALEEIVGSWCLSIELLSLGLNEASDCAKLCSNN